MIGRSIAIVLIAAGAAQAQEARVDETTVAACFHGAPRDAGVPSCVGDAANQCQTQPGGGSTIGIVACVQAETAAWDGFLNREYKATRAQVDQFDTGHPPVSEALLTAQRAWIAFRDAECSLAYERNRGGTIRSVAAASCLMRMTAQRALELRDMRGGL
ncbi:lysozyme inhibitor LprI family protein [Roseovarius sp. MMSF_3350]|uniref:lysozyme inhibitor LprI family protein n=1 Tax=Roseovarius sp. MMSF_3350 TaxID=3046706 RepID=UPI00273E91C4|nr:lysozyme inhibitor LprI family protein [Roseovarius sp. MMSF_3350]